VSDAHHERVAIAILTWRNEAVTRTCLESLTRLIGWPLPVLVVDNASATDEGLRLAADLGPPVETVTLAINGGVPGGYNAGLRWASGIGADYVLLLNNDTIVSDPEMLNKLTAAMWPGVAAVGPVVHRLDGSTQSAGGRVGWKSGRSLHIRTPPKGLSGSPYPVEWLDGSCLLVSVAAAAVVGGFADDYFLYWEDVDWGVRASRAGLQCLVQPTTSIVHLGSATVSSAPQLRYWMRNRLLFMRRNAGLRDNLTSLVSMILRTIPHHLVRQGVAPVRWVRVLGIASAAIAWNITDALHRGSWRVPSTGPLIGQSGDQP